MAFLNGSIMTNGTVGLALDWRFANAWLNAMADESGSTRSPESDQPFSSPSQTTEKQLSAQRFNLLLAEDNLPDALIVREAILAEKLPLELHMVGDGQQAIDFITRAEQDVQAPPPHVLMLDLNLPKRHGFEVLRRLRTSAKFQHVPVLIVSSSDAPADHRQAEDLRAAYFRKPPSLDEFMKLGGVLKQLLRDHGIS